jgi:hypothetical protein
MSEAQVIFDAFILRDGSSTKKIAINYEYAKTIDGLEIIAHEPAPEVSKDCDDFREDFRLQFEDHEIESIQWIK